MSEENLQELCKNISKKTDRAKIANVYRFTKKHLGSVLRRTGENYATHGIEVATAVSEIAPESKLINCALVHHILVHPDGKKLFQCAPLSAEEKNMAHNWTLSVSPIAINSGMQKRHE